MDMKYLNNKKMAYSSVMAAMLLGLAACGSSGSSTPATGGGSTGGGSTACTDIPGEPDIMGPITFTPATVKPSVTASLSGTPATATMNIPVDADTGYVGVVLSNPTDYPTSVGGYDNSSGVDFFVVASQGVQTLHIPVIVNAVTTATGDIYPQIVLCSNSIDTCKHVGGSGGVEVAYATIKKTTGFVFTRFKTFANGTTTPPPTIAQIANPTLACVAPQALAVAPAP
jgi:hypothetical protein